MRRGSRLIALEKAFEAATSVTGRLMVIDRGMAGLRGNGPLDSIIVRGKCSRWRLCHEGKGRWIPNGIKTQVDVQKRPMEVVGGRSLHAHDLVDRCMAEPREMLVRQEEFLLAGEYPEAVPGNVTDLNRESACATHRRFPPGDPRRGASPSLVARRAIFYLKRAWRSSLCWFPADDVAMVSPAPPVPLPNGRKKPCIVNGKFIALHGGIGPELRTLQDINSINRFSEPPRQGNLCDMLWADPVDTEDGKTQERFVQNGVRGCSYFYNYEAVVKFLKRNELLSIIRAHEAQLDGYRMHTWGSTSFPFVITIFSAPNYCDVYNNKGAIIKFKQGNLSIHQLVYTTHPYILPNYMDIFEWSLPFLAEKVMAVLYAILKERPRDRITEESHDHIRELQETVHVSKKDALRNKILFIARMMKIFRTLRQEHELILQLKGIYPGNKLPNGLIIEGREAILSVIEQFQRAKEWDSENEKWPEREEAELV